MNFRNLEDLGYVSFLYILAPCDLSKYSGGFGTFDSRSTFMLPLSTCLGHDDLKKDIQYNNLGKDDSPMNENSPAVCTNRGIALFYSTTVVKVSTTNLRVDFNTFVSNVGGSLGLFIGFSVLGGFFFIYDYISSKFICLINSNSQES